MNSKELLEFIIDMLTKNGGHITIEYDTENGCRTYDLNVSLKSGIKLSIEDDKLIARTRYDGRTEIKSPLDLLALYEYWFDDATTRGWGKIRLPNEWRALYSCAMVIAPVDNRN